VSRPSPHCGVLFCAQALPTWLKDLDKVVLLDLDSNEFNGTIPTEIGNMVGLQFLLLNRNSLEGDVPTELGFVTTLRKCLD
jgi:hypothetical protein